MIDQYSSLIPILQIVDEISPLQRLVRTRSSFMSSMKNENHQSSKKRSLSKVSCQSISISGLRSPREDEKSYSVPMPIMEISMNGLLDQKIQL